MLCNVCFSKHIDIFQQHSRYVKCDIALANDDGFVTAEIWLQTGAVWQTIVPPDKLPSRVDAFEGRLSRNPQLLIFGSSIGEQYRVVVAQELLKLDATLVWRGWLRS